MADWTDKKWKSALSARGTDDETEAYQRLAEYLFAFARPYLKNKSHLHLYLQRQSGADIDDLVGQFVQQALEKVWRYYDSFAWRSHVKTWATSILIREIEQFLRRNQIKREILVSYSDLPGDDDDSLDPLEYAAVTTAVQSGRMPDINLRKREFIRDLDEALMKLSPKQRYAFVECCLRERPVLEVAQELEISDDAVYQHVSRARRKLRVSMRELGYESGFDL